MRNRIRMIAMSTAMAILVATPLLTNAQDKKKTATIDKTAPKKDSQTKPESAKSSVGSIQIAEGKDGKFRYKLVDADNKYVMSSIMAYESKEAAAKAVQNMKDVLATAKITYPPKAVEPEKKAEPKKKST